MNNMLKYLHFMPFQNAVPHLVSDHVPTRSKRRVQTLVPTHGKASMMLDINLGLGIPYVSGNYLAPILLIVYTGRNQDETECQNEPLSETLAFHHQPSLLALPALVTSDFV